MGHGVCRAGRSRSASRRRPDGHDSIRRDQPLPKRELRHRHRDRGLLRVHTWFRPAEIRGAGPDRHHRGSHLCRDGVLGGIRAGRLIPQPVRRTLYAKRIRQFHRPCNLVPSTQPGVHPHSGTGVFHDVAGARQAQTGSQPGLQGGDGPDHARAGIRGDDRRGPVGRSRRYGAAHLAHLHLPAAYHGRTGAEPGGPECRHQAVSAALRGPDDGSVVPVGIPGQHPRRVSLLASSVPMR